MSAEHRSEKNNQGREDVDRLFEELLMRQPHVACRAQHITCQSDAIFGDRHFIFACLCSSCFRFCQTQKLLWEKELRGVNTFLNTLHKRGDFENMVCFYLSNPACNVQQSAKNHYKAGHFLVPLAIWGWKKTQFQQSIYRGCSIFVMVIW